MKAEHSACLHSALAPGHALSGDRRLCRCHCYDASIAAVAEMSTIISQRRPRTRVAGSARQFRGRRDGSTLSSQWVRSGSHGERGRGYSRIISELAWACARFDRSTQTSPLSTTTSLPRLAEFIARNLLFVDHVALMGLELMGFARANLHQIWIAPARYQTELYSAVRILESIPSPCRARRSRRNDHGL